MIYSRTAITELTRRYKKILKKCALLNATILVGVITVASTNAKANDWITIDGEMFSPTGYYYSGKASGSTLEVDFFTSRGAHLTHSIPYWNASALGKTTVTLTGGTFTVNYAGIDRNGPLWAKGGTLEVLGNTLTLEQVDNLTPSYIASEVAFKLKNGATLAINPYASAVINENDSIEDGTISAMGGRITFAGGTHTLGHNSWIFGSPFADAEFKITGGKINIVDGTRFTANANDDISGGTINATGGQIWIESDHTLQHNSVIADKVELSVSADKVLTVAGNSVVNVNDNDVVSGAVLNVDGGTLSFNGGEHILYNNWIADGKLAVTGGSVNFQDSSMMGGVLNVTGGIVDISANYNDTAFVTNNVGIKTAAGTTLNFEANNGYKVTLGTGMSLAGTTNLNGGEIALVTKQAAASFADAADLNIYGDTILSFADNSIETVSFTNAIKNATAFNLALDINATEASLKADKITANLTDTSKPVYLSGLNFMDDSVESGSVQIADGNLKSVLILKDSIDTGIYTSAVYDNKTGILSFSNPVSWTKRTNGMDSVYKWTMVKNTGLMPVDWNTGSTPATFYVDVLKKDYKANDNILREFKYTWNDTTKKLTVTNDDGTPLALTTGKKISDPSINYVGDYIGNTDGALAFSSSNKADAITGDFVGNENTATNGGAIANNQTTIDRIAGSFIGNSADGKFGGAIYNKAEGSVIGTVIGDFVGNFAKWGGAVYNSSNGEIVYIVGDFIGNSSDSSGGAIGNSGIISSVRGNFINNAAGLASGDNGDGGAIYNSVNASSITVEGKFVNNTATKRGGAIYTVGSVTVSGDFFGNRAQVAGGAIYTDGSLKTTRIVDSSFTGNIAPEGAAIYANYGVVEVVAQNKDAEFTNNNSTGTVGGNGYGIYNKALAHFSANQNKTLTINDKVYSTGSITINDDKYNGGNVIFNDEFTQSGKTYIHPGVAEFNGTTSLAGLTIMGSGSTVKVGQTATLTSTSTDVNSGGTLDVGTGSVNLGDATVYGTLKLEITKITEGSTTYTGGQINTDSLKLGSNSTLSLTIAPNLIDKNTSTGPLSLINVTGVRTGLFAELEANNRYKVTAEKDGKFTITQLASIPEFIQEGGGTSNDVNTGVAWDQANIQDWTRAGEIQKILYRLSKDDAETYVDALAKVQPTDSMAIVGTTQNINDLIGEQVATRLNGQGISSGDVFEKHGAWVQALYSHSKKDKTSKNNGFKGNTNGVAFGLDGDMNNDLTIGIGYAYNDTNVDSRGTKTDINGHTIFAYAKYQPSDWYLRSMLSYGYAEYEERANGTGINRKAKYDVYNYAARGYIGYDLPYGFTPEAGLRFVRIDGKSYTDTIGQHVKTNNIDVLTASLGINYSTTLTTSEQAWSPKAYVALTYDVMSDNSKSIVNIADSVYNVNGRRLNRFGVETGLGAEVSLGAWDLSAEYDFGIRHNYTNNTGMLRAKYNF